MDAYRFSWKNASLKRSCVLEISETICHDPRLPWRRDNKRPVVSMAIENLFGRREGPYVLQVILVLLGRFMLHVDSPHISVQG